MPLMPLKESHKSLLSISALHHVSMQEEAGNMQPRREPSPELDHAGNLTWISRIDKYEK